MSDDTPQDLYVRVGPAFLNFSGMSKNEVLGVLPGFGVGAVFIEKADYDAGVAALAQQSDPANR